MKVEKQAYCTDNIDQMRNELYHLIENEQLISDIVQERSRELDALILEYYKQKNECQTMDELTKKRGSKR